MASAVQPSTELEVDELGLLVDDVGSADFVRTRIGAGCSGSAVDPGAGCSIQETALPEL